MPVGENRNVQSTDAETIIEDYESATVVETDKNEQKVNANDIASIETNKSRLGRKFQSMAYI